jgi:hypothetical protein
MTLYKVLDAKGRAYHGGTGSWALPRGDRPGAWMPPLADLVLCQRGYHLCEGEERAWQAERLRSYLAEVSP